VGLICGTLHNINVSNISEALQKYSIESFTSKLLQILWFLTVHQKINSRHVVVILQLFILVFDQKLSSRQLITRLAKQSQL